MNRIVGTPDMDIFFNAIQALQRLSRVRVEQLPVWAEYGRVYKDDHSAFGIDDAFISISAGGNKRAFDVQIKGELRKDHVLPIIERFGRDKENYILIARYIPEPIKVHFKEMGINYLESAGNCCINAPGLFVYISDQKVTPVRDGIAGKLWKRTGLKFLLAVIEQPELLNKPYREIAEAAGIAIGNIGQLLHDLQSEEYLNESAGKMQLINKENLINRWAGMYGAIMKGRLKGGSYRFLNAADADAWEHLPDKGVYWGGEPGGALLTGHLTPQIFTMYIDFENNDVLRKHRIVPYDKGNILVLDKFWGALPPSVKRGGTKAVSHAAPALLVYADLSNSFDSRNHEVAARIKKNYLLHV